MGASVAIALLAGAMLVSIRDTPLMPFGIDDPGRGLRVVTNRPNTGVRKEPSFERGSSAIMLSLPLAAIVSLPVLAVLTSEVLGLPAQYGASFGLMEVRDNPDPSPRPSYVPRGNGRGSGADDRIFGGEKLGPAVASAL